MNGMAVVFGGGGIVGLGWELGVVEGLREAGVDLGVADRTIGTSAGSIVGAVLESGIPISELPERAAELAPELEALTSSIDRARVDEIGERWRAAGMRPGQAERAAIAALGSAAPTGSAEAYVDVMSRLLPVSEWPAGLTVTAVRVDDGSSVAWEAGSGVPLASAVAASCALPGVFPSVPIDGARYVDGGVRSPSNLDLAAGHGSVIVVVPSGRDELAVVLDEEGATITAAGGRVVELLPDAAGVEAIGPDLMDLERLLGAALAGFEQGREAAATLRPLVAVASEDAPAGR
jgi:NTE family protein